MSWGDIWKIILAALASVGGVAGLIILVVKFASNVIAERLSQKYQISLEKELESHKSKLDSKNYISKARFDREFAMYQELAEKHMTMVYDMGAAVMITRGAKYPGYEKTSDFVHLALKHLGEAEMMNKRYAPFISKEIFENYTVQAAPTACSTTNSRVAVTRTPRWAIRYSSATVVATEPTTPASSWRLAPARL